MNILVKQLSALIFGFQILPVLFVSEPLLCSPEASPGFDVLAAPRHQAVDIRSETVQAFFPNLFPVGDQVIDVLS